MNAATRQSKQDIDIWENGKPSKITVYEYNTKYLNDNPDKYVYMDVNDATPSSTPEIHPQYVLNTGQQQILNKPSLPPPLQLTSPQSPPKQQSPQSQSLISPIDILGILSSPKPNVLLSQPPQPPQPPQLPQPPQQQSQAKLEEKDDPLGLSYNDYMRQYRDWTKNDGRDELPIKPQEYLEALNTKSDEADKYIANIKKLKEEREKEELAEASSLDRFNNIDYKSPINPYNLPQDLQWWGYGESPFDTKLAKDNPKNINIGTNSDDHPFISPLEYIKQYKKMKDIKFLTSIMSKTVSNTANILKNTETALKLKLSNEQLTEINSELYQQSSLLDKVLDTTKSATEISGDVMRKKLAVDKYAELKRLKSNLDKYIAEISLKNQQYIDIKALTDSYVSSKKFYDNKNNPVQSGVNLAKGRKRMTAKELKQHIQSRKTIPKQTPYNLKQAIFDILKS